MIIDSYIHLIYNLNYSVNLPTREPLCMIDKQLTGSQNFSLLSIKEANYIIAVVTLIYVTTLYFAFRN